MCATNLDDIDDPFQLSLAILGSRLVVDDDTCGGGGGSIGSSGVVPTALPTVSHAEITFPVSQSGSFELTELKHEACTTKSQWPAIRHHTFVHLQK